MHRTVTQLWADYLACQSPPSKAPIDLPPAWHFCDNETDANECARLVLPGIKRATSPSLWFFDSSGESLPVVGDLNIVTDWSGQAICIIRTTHVQILPLNQITASHAKIEGEGDGSLDWWRKAHWDYYHWELRGTGYQPQPDMPVVFQQFECIFPPGAA